MEAILFAGAFTALVGYPYWRTRRSLYKPPPTNEEERKSPEYRRWRNEVLQRDGLKCVWYIGQGFLCGSTDDLEVDHIYPFAYFPKLRFDVNNGRTLCRKHHQETITYGSGAKTFYDQIKTLIHTT